MKIELILSIITNITGFITALGLILVWRQIQADHERTRILTSIQVCTDWVKAQTPQMAAAIHMMNYLSSDEACRIFKEEPIILPEKATPYASIIIQEVSNEILTKKQTILLRYQLMAYLNELEVVFSAWSNGIADHDMIVEEFAFILSHDNESTFIMGDFFKGTRPMAFPGINKYIEFVKNKNCNKPCKKPLAASFFSLLGIK